MSATTVQTIDIGSTPRTGFGRLVAVEFRKAYDTRAGFWLLGVIGIVVLLAEAIYLIVNLANDYTTTLETAVGVPVMITSILLPVLGIMLVTSEWSQRTAMVTFALEPRRGHVIAAKAVVGLLLAVATSVFGIVVGLLVTVLGNLGSAGVEWNLGWKTVVGMTLAMMLGMLAGFAIAALFLNTPASIVVFFAYTFVLPGIMGIGGALMDWFEKIRPWIDFSSAQMPLVDLSFTGDELPQLLVSGLIWFVLPLAFGTWRILRAELK